MAKGLDAGNAYVTVKVDTSGFTRDLNKNVKQSLTGAERESGKTMAGVAGIAGKVVKYGAFAAGAVAVGAITQIGKLGMEYQNSLNIFQAATSATTAQMDKVKAAARALGNDITLPGVSAKDAALAMTELAKGGLSVEQSMAAAKGTMQLATAAQIEGAQAAEIQANALAMFGLQAKDAGHVADVLANTANAASGEITDFANSMKYVGPVARALGISIDSTATALGMLANAGIKSEQAGTTMRGMLASLANPSEGAATALEQLSVKAFDANGQFVGMRTLLAQLASAQKTMTKEQFAGNVAYAFGREAMSGVIAMASQGPAAYDSMAKAVSKSGGAAQLAAAKSKGLAGAWDSLVSTLETAGLQIYDKFAPGVEEALRNFGSVLPGIIDKVGEFGSKMLTAFEDASKSPLFARIAEAVEENAPKVQDGLKKISEGVKLFVDGFVAEFKKIVDESTMTDIVDSFQRIADVLDGPVKKAFEENKDWLGFLGKALGVLVGTSLKQFQGAMNLVADVFEFVSRNAGTFKTALTAMPAALTGLTSPVVVLWDTIKAGAKAVSDFLTVTVWPGIKSGFAGFVSILDGVAKFSSYWATLVASFFAGMWSRISGPARTVTTFISTAFATLWRLVSGAVRTGTGVVIRLFTSMWTTVSGAVRTGVGVVVSYFTGLKTKVVSPLSTAASWLYNAGRNIIDGIVRGIRSLISSVGTTVGTIKSKVTGAISGAPDWLYHAGQQVIDGIVSGIKASFQKVRDAVAALAKLIPPTLTKLIQGKSPARVMIGPGRSIGEGVALGITKSVPIVEKALGGLADAARTGLGTVAVPVVAEPGLRAAAAGRGAGPVSALRRTAAQHRAAPAVVQITVNGALDPNAVGRQVVDLLRRENRLRATPVITAG